jgi:hypothetical protein
MSGSRAKRHDTSGEPDVKPGGKEMENQPEASNMVMMFERMLLEQRSMPEIATAAEWLVRRNGQFDGKDVSRYHRD